ncbi:MAG: FAD-binding oxidoreductase [Pyrinomonadaceae bacterium]|nr:FAD-binding oxidoreductase [Pyrinomonadaceae bacterium]
MQVKTQSDDIENYLTDASNMRGGYAEQIFIPASEDEIRRYLREANDNAVPVTVSGARTGTVGGAIPFGGAVLSIERLNRIVDINADTLRAVVRSGVILADLQKAVEAKGLFYPPDPTEWSCQIGGTIATNASGARSFKYGATREFVERIRIVLADGDVLDLRRGEIVGSGESLTVHTESGRSIEFALPTYEPPNVRKNVSGLFNSRPFDAIDLFIGSEGMLGVIVEAELRPCQSRIKLFQRHCFLRAMPN